MIFGILGFIIFVGAYIYYTESRYRNDMRVYKSVITDLNDRLTQMEQWADDISNFTDILNEERKDL